MAASRHVRTSGLAEEDIPGAPVDEHNHEARFGKHPHRVIKSLVREAMDEAIADAYFEGSDIELVYCSNVLAGLLRGQESAARAACRAR